MGAHVTIRVRFPDGRPAPGARIVGTNHDAWLKRHRTWSATADLSGAFTWENLDQSGPHPTITGITRSAVVIPDSFDAALRPQLTLTRRLRKRPRR